jgi:hypothetical protein
VVVLAEAVNDGQDHHLAVHAGSASTKSRPMSTEMTEGIGRGCSRPAG